MDVAILGYGRGQEIRASATHGQCELRSALGHCGNRKTEKGDPVKGRNS